MTTPVTPGVHAPQFEKFVIFVVHGIIPYIMGLNEIFILMMFIIMCVCVCVCVCVCACVRVCDTHMYFRIHPKFFFGLLTTHHIWDLGSYIAIIFANPQKSNLRGKHSFSEFAASSTKTYNDICLKALLKFKIIVFYQIHHISS